MKNFAPQEHAPISDGNFTFKDGYHLDITIDGIIKGFIGGDILDNCSFPQVRILKKDIEALIIQFIKEPAGN